jgi:hypothetical protein
MTASNDLDRRLADWLEDGPARAPERSIAFALDHAAAHPRRRDPLAALRRDPMRSPGFGGSMRMLPLAAALGLLLVAALAVATVGGLFDRTPAVVPPAIPSASPSVVPTPFATPTGPAISASSPPAVHVDLIEHVGEDASIDIVDRSGTLVDAESGDPPDGGSIEEGTIQVVADAADPNTLVLTWTGMPCDTTHQLDIAPDRTLTITRPACSGDTIPVDHVLRLTFDAPVDPATITGSVVTSGG